MKAGTVVDNRFEIERVAGRGGMGIVYRALDRGANRVVALKVLIGQSEENASRFLREAAVLAELRHPGIVGFVANGALPEGEPYLVMDWLEGESLSERLSRGPLSVAETIELGRQVAEGLGYAHARGVIHRDLKPGNLFLPDRNVARPLILDFGIARVSQPGQTITRTGTALGSPGYMAPEQARGERAIDARADLFSFGCVLFRCLAGEPPFTGDALAAMLKAVTDPAPLLSSYRADIPPALEDLIQAMLAKPPDARPRDTAAVGAALAALAGGATRGSGAGATVSLRPVPAGPLGGPTPLPVSAGPLGGPTPFPTSGPLGGPTPFPMSAQPAISTPQPLSSRQPPSGAPASSAPVTAATSAPAAAVPRSGPRTGLLVAALGLAVVVAATVAAIVVVVVLRPEPTVATRPAAGGKPAPVGCTSTRCEDITYPDPAHVDPLDLWKRVVPLVKEIDATATFTGLMLSDTVDGTVPLVGDYRTRVVGRAMVFSFVTKGGRGLEVSAIPGRLIVNESTGGKQPVPFPGCRPRDAYRAAVANGGPRSTPAALMYTLSPAGAPEWTYWVADRNDSFRRIDGVTCAMKKQSGK